MGYNDSIYIRKKIVFLNVFLTILIVVLHAVPLLRFGIGVNREYSFIYSIYILCQIAIPLFFFISAYLFYSTCSSYKDAFNKIKRRYYSLFIPYLLWNFIFTSIYFILSCFPIFYSNMNAGNDSFHSWTDFVFGILDSKFTPLWFVKNLIFYILLSPVILFLLRNRILFLIAFVVSIIIYLKCDYKVYDSFWNGLPMYLMGAYIGYWKICLTKSRFWLLFSCLIIAGTYFLSLYDESYLLSFRLTTPIIIWFIFDWVLYNYIMTEFHLKKWMGYTFFIYCTHYFILNVIQKIIVKTFDPEIWVLNLTFILSPFVAIITIIGIANILSKYKLYKILTGGR